MIPKVMLVPLAFHVALLILARAMTLSKMLLRVALLANMSRYRADE